MNILAIDPATKAGWCSGPGIFGLWDLSTKRDQSSGIKLLKLKSELRKQHELNNLELIVYERPAGRNITGIMSQSKFVAIIESFAEENDIQYKGYSPGEIKKFATGKGNCGKPAMIAAAQKAYGYEGDDDNEADAIHLWYLATDEFVGNIFG